jgi:hypothetical protein
MTVIQRFDGRAISQLKDCYSFNWMCLSETECRSIKYIEEQIEENQPIPESVLTKLDKIWEKSIGMDREY